MISELHRMVGTIERHTDAKRLNEIVNDPSVYPEVRGPVEGRLDLSKIVEDPGTILLVGEHGALLFQQLEGALYEVHSQCLPAGRGEWMLSFTQACLHLLFVCSPAMELLTRCPHGNFPAEALAKRAGMRLAFTNPKGWVKNDEVIPARIYALNVQDWWVNAPGLEERGAWFRAELDADYERRQVEHEWPDNPLYDRVLGLALEMLIGEQAHKGLFLYSRWARMSDLPPLDVALADPPTLDLGDAFVVVRPWSAWIASLHDERKAA